MARNAGVIHIVLPREPYTDGNSSMMSGPARIALGAEVESGRIEMGLGYPA